MSRRRSKTLLNHRTSDNKWNARQSAFAAVAWSLTHCSFQLTFALIGNWIADFRLLLMIPRYYSCWSKGSEKSLPDRNLLLSLLHPFNFSKPPFVHSSTRRRSCAVMPGRWLFIGADHLRNSPLLYIQFYCYSTSSFSSAIIIYILVYYPTTTSTRSAMLWRIIMMMRSGAEWTKFADVKLRRQILCGDEKRNNHECNAKRRDASSTCGA